MICSACNKNVAVIFINKVDENGSSLEGLCYNCAKEKGINPLEVLAKQANLTEENLDDMSKQFEDIFKDISENIDAGDIDVEVMGQNSADLPISSIISSMFGGKSVESLPPNAHAPEPLKEGSETGRRKVRTEKVPRAKKRNFLDTYGTNLTEKARANKLDAVVGREREIRSYCSNIK